MCRSSSLTLNSTGRQAGSGRWRWAGLIRKAITIYNTYFIYTVLRTENVARGGKLSFQNIGGQKVYNVLT